MADSEQHGSEKAKEEVEYQAPEIESVVTPADVEREVHYAGGASQVTKG
jgi:hypothetical protein